MECKENEHNHTFFSYTWVWCNAVTIHSVCVYTWLLGVVSAALESRHVVKAALIILEVVQCEVPSGSHLQQALDTNSGKRVCVRMYVWYNSVDIM